MTTAKQLNNLLEDLAQLTDMATSKESAEAKGLDKYLYLEYASVYGGWRLVNVGVNNGGHYGAFGSNATEPRLKAKEMEIKLRGIMAGVNYSSARALKTFIA